MSIIFRAIDATSERIDSVASGLGNVLIRAAGSWRAVPDGEGTGSVVVMAIGAAEAVADVTVVVPVVGSGYVLAQAAATAQTVSYAVGDGFIQLAARAYQGGGAANEAFGEGGVFAAAAGSQSPTLAGYGWVIEQSPYVTSLGGQWFGILADALNIGARARGGAVAVLGEAVALHALRAGRADSNSSASDELLIADALVVLWRATIQDGLVIGTTVASDPQAAVRAVARVMLSGQAQTVTDAVAALTSAIVIGSATEHLAAESVADRITLQSYVVDTFTAVQRQIERLLLQAAAGPSFTAMAVLAERVGLGAAPASGAELHSVIEEAIGLFLTLAIDDQQYIAWVLNSTGRGLSNYRNYPFNSFARIGDRYYGASSMGLYRLGGPSDAGEPIAAKLRIGLSNLGESRLKRLPEAFVAYTSDGTLLLRVIVVDEETGEKAAATYMLPELPATAPRMSRWKPGKGLESVEWDFQIENTDGADFALKELQWRPVYLSRRTRR